MRALSSRTELDWGWEIFIKYFIVERYNHESNVEVRQIEGMLEDKNIFGIKEEASRRKFHLNQKAIYCIERVEKLRVEESKKSFMIAENVKNHGCLKLKNCGWLDWRNIYSEFFDESQVNSYGFNNDINQSWTV